MYIINDALIIPTHEVWFEFSHSAGPGGQNVNKLATRATLCFSLANSSVLTNEQKTLVAERLASRISSDQVLRISCDETRGQAANRTRAAERFCELLREAIKTPIERKVVKEPLGRILHRLKGKSKRASIKRSRKKFRC